MRAQLRLATHADIPALVAVAAGFYAASQWAARADFCSRSCAATAGNVIDNGFILLAQVEGRIVGALGVIVAPFAMNLTVTAGTEAMWYVDPDARRSGAALLLLRRAAFEAQVRGCRWLTMATLAESPPQAAALYERLGYRLAESSYLLEL